MIRPKGMNDCSCSPWQRLKEQIQALYERVTQVEQVNIDQTGDIQDLDLRVTALEDAPVVPPEWGNITGDLEDQTDLKDALDSKADASSLAPVALSGDYDDLSNKPTIPDAQVQADWNEADTTAVDYIKNKPTIPAEITVDSSMIQDSTNPVQSKVIQTALLDKPNIQVWNTAPTTASSGVVGDFWLDTSNNKLYQLKTVTPGTDPDPDTYTWTEVGGGSSDDPIENKIVVYSSPNLILDNVSYTVSDFVATFIIPYVKSKGKSPCFWMVDPNGYWLGLAYQQTINLDTDGFKYIYVRYIQTYLYSSNYELTTAFQWTASTETVGISWLTVSSTRDYNGVVHQASTLESTINAGTYAADTTLMEFATLPSGKYPIFTILILPPELVSLIKSGDVKIFNAGFFNLTLKTTTTITLNADAKCALSSICASQPYANIWYNIGMNTQDYVGIVIIKEYDSANQTFKQYFPETY